MRSQLVYVSQLTPALPAKLVIKTKGRAKMIIETIAQTNYHTTTTTDIETAKMLADLHKDTSTLFTITDYKYHITYYEVTWRK